MLIGEYTHSLDAKGRVNFPARLREDLGDRFIITKGLDESLFVYSLEEWNKLDQKLSELPLSKSRMLKRFFYAGAVEVEGDKQGRVIIPQNLREYAGLSKDVTVVGASTRAEIWDSARWASYCEDITPEMVAEAMDELGF